MNLLLACPTRGNVWYETAMGLAELANEPEVGDFLYVHNNRSVIEARTEIVRAFLEGPHDVLVMIDDDIVPNPQLLQLAWAVHGTEGAGIIGAPCPIALPGMPILPNIYTVDVETDYYAIDLKASLEESSTSLRRVDAIGFGAVAISRSLADSQPTFANRYDEHGQITMGEDIDYCVRAAQIGYSTYAALGLICDHRMELHGAGMAKVFAGMLTTETNA